MHKIKITMSDMDSVERALKEAQQRLNYALDVMANEAEDSDEEKCYGDHPLLQTAAAHQAVSEALRDLKKGFQIIKSS